MQKTLFPAPKSNDYQWRNLYLKQYGICTYAPPMPQNLEVMTANALKLKSREKNDDNNISASTQTVSLDSEEMEMIEASCSRHSALSPSRRKGGSVSTQGFRRSLLEVQRRSTVGDFLESLSDQQLFSANVFSFLSQHESEAASSQVLRNPLGLDAPSSLRFPSILRNSQVNASNRTAFPRGSSVDEGGKLVPDPADDLLRLQRETWQLLMDNRIMLWFEREAKKRGRIAAVVQRRLLEVVTWKLEGQQKAPNKKPGEDGTSNATAIGTTEEGTGKDGAVKIIPMDSEEEEDKPELGEEEKLMQTLEQFAPFFAVISAPEVIQRMTASLLIARKRGRRHEVPRMIGLPLFSQYNTWRETYENRVAWSLSPFSFFLIHDHSYNHAHISALYVLLDLIGSSFHLHTAECLKNENKRQVAIDIRQRRIRSDKYSLLNTSLCPLNVAQRLTEDILLAYENSTARTTLSMALCVQEFLTELVLDPDTASSFLSNAALRRQCGTDIVVPGNDAGSFSATSKKNEISFESMEDGTKNEQQEPNKDEADVMPTEESQVIDWSSLKKLTDTTFDELFSLVNWFVDTPTANSLISSEARTRNDSLVLANASPARGKKGLASQSLAFNTSLLQESKKSSQQQALSDESTVQSKESGYIVGYVREYDATMTIVEAITRYELQRQRMAETRSGEQRQRNSVTLAHRKNRRKRLAASRTQTYNDSAAVPDLYAGATLLSTPLTFITTYIRLHGATWLMELLERLFSILRRESVLLYVNGLEMEAPRQSSFQGSISQLSLSGDRSNDVVSGFGPEVGCWRNSGQKRATHNQRLELLEDLICQDIQYVMGEFCGALFGKRSVTRLPQGISTLLTNFCTTVHLHLLQQHVSFDITHDKPAIAVRKCLTEMRQKRVTGGGTVNMWSQNKPDSIERLIRNIEGNRLAKFILFDCWILPTLNNAVEFGYISEEASNHLRWNLDAFARYLKIVLNSSFSNAENTDVYIHTILPRRTSLQSQRGRMTPSVEKKGRTQSEAPLAPRCDIVKLPPLINGVYDIVSGSLMQLLRDPCDDFVDDSHERFTFGDGSSSVDFPSQKDANTSCSLKDTRRSWEDLSPALSYLNESLGITSGDADVEVYEDEVDVTPVRILNIFAAKACSNTSTKVVVTEYEVAPSIAAACISKTFSLVSGEHPIVRNAYLSGALVGQFRSSPYLTCLIGVLLHPHTASRFLENILHNNRAFYNALLQPLQDENLLNLISPLVTTRNHLPLVDSNELLSLIAAIPMHSTDTGICVETKTGDSEKKMRDSVTTGETKMKNLQLAAWETTTSNLLQKRARATTGDILPPAVNFHPQIRRIGPTDSYQSLRATAEVLTREMGRAPLCFDTWWRAMVVALTVKAMNVIEECSETKSMQWENWCNSQLHEMQRESRGLCTYFTKNKGKNIDISKEKALSYTRVRSRLGSSVLSSVTKVPLARTVEEQKKVPKGRKRVHSSLKKKKK
ncbi:hypothetical protein TcG_06685 [Trypanosoma cruzi]|nr:hypothetical protein TcG_06685 [Trypanosoma cruzi]